MEKNRNNINININVNGSSNNYNGGWYKDDQVKDSATTNDLNTTASHTTNDLNTSTSPSELQLNKTVSDNFEFSLDNNDTIFILTRNNSIYKEGVSNIVSKLVIIDELQYVNLDKLSVILGGIGIDKLNILSIDNKSDLDININQVTSDKNSKVTYTELNISNFVNFLNVKHTSFLDYNKHSLYIVRGGNFIDIKNLFSTINNCQTNLGRWRWSKSPSTQPLGF
jgi:hypothetical protein